VIRTNKRQ